YASPTVRRLARERGIDLTTISGTGDGGRITKSDVEAAEPGAAPAKAPKQQPKAEQREPAEAKPQGETAPASGGSATPADDALGLAPWPKVNFEKFGEVERVPLSRIGKLSAANLARNWVRIPHVTHNDEADITELEAFRKQLNAEQQEVKVTMVA